MPKRPPKIDIGSFECVPSSVNDITRDVIVYWQIVHENEKHSVDDLFEYRAYYTSMADNSTVSVPSLILPSIWMYYYYLI